MSLLDVPDTRADTTGSPTADPSPAAATRSRVTPVAGVLLLVGAAVAWELGVRLTGTPEWIVPAPTAVVRALVDGASSLAPAALVTLGEAAAGLVLGTAVGLALAVVITFFRNLEQAVLSMALLAKSTPIIAVAPILTIWLGFGHAPKVLVTALLTFFPMLVNALEGFRSLDPAIEDWFASVDADPVTVFRHARWPTSWPYLFAALKVSAPLAMIGAVVAEWMGASSGLGRSMWLAYTNLRMPALFAAVLVLTALSALVYHLVTRLERRALAWRRA
ncbi:ABC transporter permease [Salsipaludibacter albus]|uniref:ABC transporter permease n=1 Tax=Salsipaludibacter albus TaxID=2849650 RepID=UPI001EE3B613|nr:ABC transporter permease [Salsipaludibacter albus]MBY5162494.1 ABC transporter permease [Salsipaludibacter albus]